MKKIIFTLILTSLVATTLISCSSSRSSRRGSTGCPMNVGIVH